MKKSTARIAVKIGKLRIGKFSISNKEYLSLPEEARKFWEGVKFATYNKNGTARKNSKVLKYGFCPIDKICYIPVFK